MQPRPVPERCQTRCFGDSITLRKDAAALLQRATHGPRGQVHCDEVQHERCDHLAHA